MTTQSLYVIRNRQTGEYSLSGYTGIEGEYTVKDGTAWAFAKREDAEACARMEARENGGQWDVVELSPQAASSGDEPLLPHGAWYSLRQIYNDAMQHVLDAAYHLSMAGSEADPATAVQYLHAIGYIINGFKVDVEECEANWEVIRRAIRDDLYPLFIVTNHRRSPTTVYASDPSRIAHVIDAYFDEDLDTFVDNEHPERVEVKPLTAMPERLRKSVFLLGQPEYTRA